MVHGLIFFSTLAGGINAGGGGVSSPTSVEEVVPVFSKADKWFMV